MAARGEGVEDGQKRWGFKRYCIVFFKRYYILTIKKEKEDKELDSNGNICKADSPSIFEDNNTHVTACFQGINKINHQSTGSGINWALN